MNQNESFEDRADKWLYWVIGRPFYFVTTLTVWGLISLGITAPIAILFYGIGFWLIHGRWLPYDICRDFGYFCPTGRLVGADKILAWLSESPFALTILVSIVAVTIGVSLSIVIDEMWARSESRYGSGNNKPN